MEFNDEGMLLMNIDECDLYRPKGFVTVALAHNDDIGRLCAIRKLDQSTKAKRLIYLEFYNTINVPNITLEWKCFSRNVAFEVVAWLENYAVVGCSDGALVMFSPFNHETKRFILCASPIVAIATISASQIAIASESSEVKLLEFDAENEEFATKKTIKFRSEQRVVSLAASLKLSCVAVGLIDSIVLIQVPSGQQSTIVIPQNANMSTVVWSLLFVDDVLFSGDSRGKVMIYNPKTGALIKTITTHQADIQALAYGDGKIYASGTDYRIQVLSQIQSTNKKLEWTTTNQQIFHENDVRCMAKIGRWLVSGGAGHQLFVSNDKHEVYNIASQPRCSVTADGRFIVTPYLDQIKIWKRPSMDADIQEYEDVGIFMPHSGPKLAAKLTFWDGAILLQAVVAPNGKHLVVSLNQGLTIYSLHLDENDKLTLRTKRCIPSSEMGQVTALCAINSAFYFSHGDATFERVDFETLKRTIIAVRQSGSMLVKIAVDESEEHCLALTARSELLHIDLNAAYDDEEERFEKLDISEVPTDFKFHVTKQGDPMVILVVSGWSCKLILLNLRSKQEVRTPIDLHGCAGSNLITNVSDVVDNSIVLQETRGACCVVCKLNDVQSFAFSLHKPKSRKPKPTEEDIQERKRTFDKAKQMAYDEVDDDEDGDADELPVEEMDAEKELEPFFQHKVTKKSRSKKNRVESVDTLTPPFPFESHLFLDESGKPSIIRIGSQPVEPPTCVPFNIRRFNR